MLVRSFVKICQLIQKLKWDARTCTLHRTLKSYYPPSQKGKQADETHYNLSFSSSTGLFEMIVGVLTTCHTQYTWDSSICIFLFNRTTLQAFVTYLTGALYVHPLWFYKHQHASQVYCVWQVVKILTVILNNHAQLSAETLWSHRKVCWFQIPV